MLRTKNLIKPKKTLTDFNIANLHNKYLFKLHSAKAVLKQLKSSVILLLWGLIQKLYHPHAYALSLCLNCYKIAIKTEQKKSTKAR